MQHPNNTVVGEEERREEVTRLRQAVVAVQKAYSRETNQDVKQTLQVELAGLQQQLQKLLKELGLGGVSQKKGAPMTLRAAELHLPTRDMTPSMIADLAAAGMATPEGVAALVALAAGGGGRPLITPWQVPPMPKAPDVPSIAQFFAESKSFKALQPVQRCDKDPFFKKGGGLANFATNKPSPQMVGQDAEWISLLQQVGSDGPATRIYELMATVVQEYYVGSGPLDGWFARLKAGDAIARPQFKLFPHEEDAVLGQLPHHSDRVRALKDLTLKEALDTIKVNPTADSGFPRNMKKGLCMPLLIKDACQYFELLSAKGFNEYARKNPGEFLSVCKNKHDRYETADIGKKIRPYFNSNGGLSLLYSICMQNYSRALCGFWEDRNSCNAHGFSWNAGGGQRLYEWVVWASKQKPGVYAIGYSDDGIWVLVGTDGKVWVSDKDIAQCDMSVGQSHRPTMLKHFRQVVGDKLGPGWQQVAVAAITNIWTQVVVMYGSLTYLSTDKVHSGAVGTAEADQIGFSTMLALLRGAYDRARGTPLERFAEAEEEVKRRIGLRFKPSTWHEFKPDQAEYPWSFLGKRLVSIKGRYYPHVDLKKCIVQLLTPKRNLGGEIGQKAWMERARGLAVTSLWTHPFLYDAVKEAYDRKYVMGTRPAPTFDGADTGEEDLAVLMGYGVTCEFPNAKFPERSWVQAMYAPPGTPVERKHGEVTVPVLLVKERPTVAEAMAELYPEQDQPAWADRDDDAQDVQHAAKDKLGDGQRIKDLPVAFVNPGPAQFTIAPLPQAMKDAFNEARRKARQLLQLAGGSKARIKKGGRVYQLEHGDHAHVVFTAKGIMTAYEEAADRDIEESGGYIEEHDEIEDHMLDAMEEERYWKGVEGAYNRETRLKHVGVEYTYSGVDDQDDAPEGR